jgi:hypothetical protein
MNLELLRKHIKIYKQRQEEQPEEYVDDLKDRKERVEYYQSWARDKLLEMNEEDLYEYLSKLWAMLIWGNKHYVVDKLIQDHGLKNVRKELAELVWGEEDISMRWDLFRKKIKGVGPAMMSEILCHVHPDECMIWNRRAYVSLNYLGFKDLPRYNYQVTGKKYKALSREIKKIVDELRKISIKEANLLMVDYFIWDELQVEENLSQLFTKDQDKNLPETIEEEPDETSDFIHDEIRDKIADIGQWLGFLAQVEIKVAEGSKVDAIWEATIGNMGRVIYVFEVQTKGSIDSLILNLLKSMNNPAVQGVVAVSDEKQLERIRKHAFNVGDLGKKLKYWNYKEVLENHEALAAVNESINRLGLVPQGF